MHAMSVFGLLRAVFFVMCAEGFLCLAYLPACLIAMCMQGR